MSIIDGIGDEVTYFFVGITAFLLVTVAWITTDIQQSLYIRTVYLLDNSRVHQTRARLSNHTESATISEGITSAGEPHPDDVDVETSGVELDEEDAAAVEIIRAMDASDEVDDAAVLRRRRVDHFEGHLQAVGEPCILPTAPPEIECQDADETMTASITIKLKYLNDDLKIVDGRLEEKLGDFKRRHFNVELAANKLVRLIFNGQVLQADAQTLESYGMFDNCVVHCLVQQPRGSPTASNSPPSSLSRENSSNRAMHNAPQREWDLCNVFIITLSFILGSAWYFRFQYPQLFTISTTVGLVALSGLFSVISMSVYLPNFVRRMQVVTLHGIRDPIT